MEITAEKLKAIAEAIDNFEIAGLTVETVDIDCESVVYKFEDCITED
jgi:Tfp pilus assembly PilM family ATPase